MNWCVTLATVVLYCTYMNYVLFLRCDTECRPSYSSVVLSSLSKVCLLLPANTYLALMHHLML